ncbi:aryl-alcohol dehydrogenase-like predicted oxidoreductase [Saccharothrix tamanrassetensis]|uniref:Aryl-alcohol dehydrogenase-like predicted oxidoreductase n=1 Tax=Saccharothrix tamanrassetensis TaxID=1051531 RepID=A0A841CFS7_9PSEU|nr:aldo/keto reductase [Saccharothrix tamanrassetensis]MBB5954556.1 aryl-alcohol dehydrogenase-like predicted oxidoreductase [Saccharothrix tamanrassetensis]
MQQRRIGDVQVSAIGLGGMPMSLEGRPPRERSIATIRSAVEAGVTLIDTADAYSADETEFGHNEELIAQALKGVDGVLVATKGGHTRTPGGGWGLDGRPEYLKSACEASLRRLGVDAIDLYQFHRPDPDVPTAESVGALADLLDEGKIRLAGVSNFDPAQIREAHEVLGGRLASVQNQFSPAFRSSEPELELCARLGVAFLPWSPLGGMSAAGDLGERFGAFGDVARERGVSPQQVCLAWMLAKAPAVIPIPGSSRPESIRDSAAAAHLELSEDELKRLDG